MNNIIKNNFPDFREYIYTDQKTIIEELSKRKKNKELSRKVNDIWGNSFPPFLLNTENTFGFFCRPLVSPNMETRLFIDIVSNFNIEPLLLSYPDKFVTINKSKYYLAKPHIFFTSKSELTKVRRIKLVDFNKWEGSNLYEVQTLSGKSLLNLHRDWFGEVFPEHKNNTVDIYDWFNKVRFKYDELYYFDYLLLGIYHGVIFENFLFNENSERVFFENKVLQSFIKIEKIFGLKPLIFQTLPTLSEQLDGWYYYPHNPIVNNYLDFYK